MILFKKNILLFFLIISLISIEMEAQNILDSEPLNIVKSIADKVISETVFEYELIPQEEVLGLQVVDFKHEFGMSDGYYYALSFMQSEIDTTTNIGISASPEISVWINDRQIEFQSSAAPSIKEIAYGMVNFEDTIGVKLIEGSNKILIKTSGTNSKILLCHITSDPETKSWIKFTTEPLSVKSGTSSWLTVGPVHSRLESVPEQNLKKYYRDNDKYLTWTAAKQNIITKLKINPENVYTRDPYADWNYSNGATLFGIFNFAQETKDQKYFKFINEWCNNIIENIDYFRWQYDRLFALRGTFHRIYRKSMLDDAGAPALPFVLSFLEKKDEKYYELISEMTDYVMNDQVRLDDGTFCRPEPVEMTVWADDLFMSVPMLLRMAEITGDKKYYDESARQIINFTKLLFNKDKKLFKHGWFSETKETSVAFWGRANGWVMWALSEALLLMPEDHPGYTEIMNIYQQHVEGLMQHQDDSGMWHQVLDYPESYEESSCTAMFILGISRGVLNGWLDASYSESAIKAWNALTKQIEPEGIVHGICRGTGIGYDLKFYFERPTFANDPRGLGSVLTAGVEISKLLTKMKK